MRQAQQNRRGRGRGNNNRKSQNPLTRSYESNGPDVKIRGTPSHIAEKYVTMARDALSSGDPVLAENYLQHAEHYNRIIMTHREQQSAQANDQQNSHNNISRHRGPSEPVDDDANENTSDEKSTPRGSEPQPSILAGDRTEDSSEGRPPRRNSRSRNDRPAESGSGERQPRSNGRSSGRRTRYEQTDDQPEFLKRPVRRSRSSSAKSDEGEAPEPASDQAAE